MQQNMLRSLASMAAERDMYLAGGTALAIQVGHRRSVDLDWFSPSAIEPMALAADLKSAGIPFQVTDVDEGTLHGKAGGVKLSFLEYRYPDLVPPIQWPDYGVRLAALEDLACMKLSAVGGRGSKKDFIDIFALGRETFSLDQMLKLYGQKYEIALAEGAFPRFNRCRPQRAGPAPLRLGSATPADVELIGIRFHPPHFRSDLMR